MGSRWCCHLQRWTHSGQIAVLRLAVCRVYASQPQQGELWVARKDQVRGGRRAELGQHCGVAGVCRVGQARPDRSGRE